MATGATFVDFGEKRLLGNADFGSRFLDHLRGLVQESFEKSFRTGVVYDIALTLSAAGNDKFDIGGTSQATDGLGHILDIAASGFASGIQFENVAAIDYDVALHYAEVPDDIQVNPRKGFPEYVGTKEFIGELANPTTIVDNTTTLTFGVDSVAEAGVSHAGRTCRVFKKIPGKNGTTPGVAIEDVVVTWTGTFNEITTSGVLGQESPNSTTPADYTVVMLGPTVRRNTSLFGVDGYAFLGTVTGTGAGNPPVTFDTTNQDLIVASLSDLSDITSRKSTDRLRIDVKSFAGDVGEDQILVRNPSGTPVFQVDGNGNVTIAGTTTQQDVVQVNSSETITDNLTAGDNDAVDSHLIKGQWKHTNNAGSATYFFVDGATGRIGINQVAEAAASEGMLAQLGIAGNVRQIGDYRVQSATPNYQYSDTGNGVATGGLWRTVVDTTDWSLQENTAAAGDFSTQREWINVLNASNRIDFDADLAPLVDDTRDLGLPGQEWRNLNIDGIANVDELVLGVAAGEGIGSDALPDATNSRDLGSTSRRYAETHTRDFYLGTTLGEGVHTNFMPDGDNTRDLGSLTQRWANLFVTNLNFSGDFLPQIDNTQDVGSSTFRWAEGHYGQYLSLGDANPVDTISTFNIDRTLITTTHRAINSTLQSDGGAGTNSSITGYFSTVLGQNASGTDTLVAGMFVQTAVSGDGLTTQMYGARFVNQILSPHTVTINRGIWIDTSTIGGTVTSIYALDIIGPDGQATTDNFNIRSVDGSHQFSQRAQDSATKSPIAVHIQHDPGDENVHNHLGAAGTGNAALLIEGGDYGGGGFNFDLAWIEFAPNQVGGAARGYIGMTSATDVLTVQAAGGSGIIDLVWDTSLRMYEGGTQFYSFSSTEFQAKTRGRFDNSTTTDFALLLGDNAAQADPLFSGTGPHIKAQNPNVWWEDTNIDTGTVGRVMRMWANGSATEMRLDRYNESGGGVAPADLRIRQLIEVNHPFAQMEKTSVQSFTATWTNLTGFSSSSSESVTVSTANGTYTVLHQGSHLIFYTIPQGLQGTIDSIMQARITVNGSLLNGSHSRMRDHNSVGKGSMSATVIANDLQVGDVVRIQIQERTDSDGIPGAFGQVRDSVGSNVANVGFGMHAIRIGPP